MREKINFGLVTICIFTLSMGVTTLLWSHLETVKVGYRISRLEKRKSYLDEERKALEVEKLSLSDLSRIEKISREKLTMIFPKNEQILFVIVTKQ
ncbi:MAG: cell division protein FtsL [Nitrospinota bacterium]|nr:cell division protein FtsL [Nitrospinota bacterium]